MIEGRQVSFAIPPKLYPVRYRSVRWRFAAFIAEEETLSALSILPQDYTQQSA